VQAGAQDDQRQELLRRLLLGCHLTPFDPVVYFDVPALIYRRCGAGGITPRGMLHCMIVAVAWRTGATPLAQDAHLNRVAAVAGIPLGQG
jgi:predicted nucleic acid-binding protein